MRGPAKFADQDLARFRVAKHEPATRTGPPHELDSAGCVGHTATPIRRRHNQGLLAGGIIACWGWIGDVCPVGRPHAAIHRAEQEVAAQRSQAHCVTTGVDSLQLDYVRLLSSITSPAQDLTTGSDEMLAVYDDASGGMVIVLPDDNPWADSDSGSDAYLTDADNAAILLNIFACAGATSPTTSTSWGRVKARYR